MKTQIGHYYLLSELGRGGMGVVYKAYEPALERYVAIKELASSLSHDPALVERFIREARAMAALNDPHIIQIHYIGQDAEPPYFAMEFIEGESLSSLLEREGPLKVSDALKICQQAARGLSAAHTHGVIHRDIKPSNLMLNKRGQVKIADFGIAFTQRDISKKLTSTGDVVGTPGYLSPEVCLGNPVDARSDLFALGIVLYEMLSKELPFNDPSPLKLMLSVVESEVPDIRKLNRDIDENTIGILNKLLAKNPDHRYQSAEALLSDIAQHAAIADTTLSVHARLPSGAASTMLQTPGLAKVANATMATQITPPPNNLPDAKRRDQKRNIFWLLPIAGLLVALGLSWFLQKPNAPAANRTITDSPPSNTEIAPYKPQEKAVAAPVIIETAPERKANDASAIVTTPAIEKPIKNSIKESVVAETKPTSKTAAANTEPLQTMQKYGEVYLGPQNEEVSVAHANGTDIAYVKVTGINSPYDGKVIRTVPRPASYDGMDYAIQYEGSDYVVLVKRKYSGRDMYVALFLPGLGGEIKLTFDGALSKQLSTDAIRDEFLKQKQ
jgi:eukaryotic-like serine/threonine-protein kinase